jgi:hypothetical protein
MLTKNLDFKLTLIGAGKCGLQCLVEDISQKNCVRKLVKCLSGRTYSLPSRQCHCGRTGPGRGGGRPGRPMACHCQGLHHAGPGPMTFRVMQSADTSYLSSSTQFHGILLLLYVNTFLLFRGYSTGTHIIQVQFTNCTYYIRTLRYVGRG